MLCEYCFAAPVSDRPSTDEFACDDSNLYRSILEPFVYCLWVRDYLVLEVQIFP